MRATAQQEHYNYSLGIYKVYTTIYIYFNVALRNVNKQLKHFYRKTTVQSVFIVILKVREKVMNKKILVTIGIIFAVILTSAVTFALTGPMREQQHKPSDYKIGIEYQEALKSDKPMLALFYVDWCGYCLKFMPKYKIVSNIYKDKFNVVMLNAENPENLKLVEDVSLSGFPTLYILDPKYDNRVLLNNGIYMDMKKLRVELDRFLRIRALLDGKN